MAIIWLDVWNSQNKTSAKRLINCCFNVGKYITTIRRANMNLGVLQCKKCQKQGHSTYVCKVQGSRYVKYNSPHLTEHHREFLQCCKANTKSNLSKLETKADKPCPHSFKCVNCKEDYQADPNLCPFWYYHFNKKQHSKKYAKIHNNQKQTINSVVNGLVV